MIISAYTHLKQYFLLQSHGVRVFDTNIIVLLLLSRVPLCLYRFRAVTRY